ncbi:type II toxin-antitoxin system PemK/MazF family toxin [Candidatus Woesearchaeota archaeon]|nr:MAG: hypothetical protein QS99_C0008G0021 [archaeon GW2011_AR4]MBS3129665.1 type II toxin-antitoxin system PemK/MazF family toxin [Candidatus Woesearchaeota archaeon]HIH38769.1 type II toxin-antitoxin system PemK/MazF family toxin [Candidatus Woesearchaeota archaeon]HIH49185.1 type II toxin-antitoxin system PemK/MazF family toxin [Candidatus Woesearchaeota archaeon]HIJ03327.1 type II toxin-antitoxin system PemK/MazF family toxin [Candidatus Woesearchaeota archaeon]
METFVKGDVVVLPFPFSDLSDVKRRPALVAATLEGDECILCQITSRMRSDKYSISLTDEEFQSGSLKATSRIRPNRMFSADESVIRYKIGSLKQDKVKEVEERIIDMFKE